MLVFEDPDAVGQVKELKEGRRTSKRPSSLIHSDSQSQQALQDAVTIDGLLAHAQALEDIAYATPGRNRVVASAGHNNTVKYIVDQLEALGGFYHVELQPFNTTLQLDGNATFIVNGVNYTASPLEWSSSVSLTDLPVVPVAAQGCFAVSHDLN